MHYADVIRKLNAEANPTNVEGMARYGISTKRALGVSVPFLRKLGRQTGANHALAGKLWRSGIHEARILAALVDEPERVTEAQMERWAKQIDSWDICDLLCSNLLDKTPFAHDKAVEWSARPEEFVKRAGFVLMACLAVHHKTANDAAFRRFLPIIKREATDERNFVKKAVNWALRQIGKRNRKLHAAAVRTAEAVRKIDAKAARWIASDALRELRNPKTLARLTRGGR